MLEELFTQMSRVLVQYINILHSWLTTTGIIGNLVKLYAM